MESRNLPVSVVLGNWEVTLSVHMRIRMKAGKTAPTPGLHMLLVQSKSSYFLLSLSVSLNTFLSQ